MSTILCIIDGMTDENFKAEDYPCLDSYCRCGLMDTTPQGHDTETLVCILNILGAKNIPHNLRGYVEALGCNIPAEKDDLILRASWQSVDENGVCGGPVAAPESIGEFPGLKYYYIGDYKSILIFEGQAKALETLKTEPPYRAAGRKAAEFRPEGFDALEGLFDALNEGGRMMVPWGQSAAHDMEPFPVKAAAVCGSNILSGIARILGIAVINPVGATGDVDTDVTEKLNAALEAAGEYPFVLLHFNGSDEASHKLNPDAKRAFIEEIDKKVLPVLKGSEHKVFVMADHGTSPATGRHMGGLQMIYSNRKEDIDGKRKPFFL